MKKFNSVKQDLYISRKMLRLYRTVGLFHITRSQALNSTSIPQKCISVRALSTGFLQNIFHVGYVQSYCRNKSFSDSKFSIKDEVLNGRPLYLDAQATTPLVRNF